MSASGSTPGGLPYPTADDRLADTPDYIGELADAAAVRLANPGVETWTKQIQTDANGVAWLQFPTLSECHGCIPQVLITSNSRYVIWPTVIQRGENSALVRFRRHPVNGYTAEIVNHVGLLTVCAYAWGVPA